MSVWELAGSRAEDGWGIGTSPIVGWFCGGRETSSNLTNMAPGEFAPCVLQHCVSAALSWPLSQLLLRPPCSGPQSMSLLSPSDEHSPLGPEALVPLLSARVSGWGGKVGGWSNHSVVVVVAPRQWLSWHVTAP